MKEIEPAELGLGNDFKDLVLAGKDTAGEVYDGIQVVEGKRVKVLVRVLNFDFEEEKLVEIKSKVSEEDFLLDTVALSPRVLVTKTQSYERISDLNITEDPTQILVMNEYEATGIGFRVLKILEKADLDDLRIFNIYPENIFVKQIPGVHISERKTTHILKLGEPYLHYFFEHNKVDNKGDVYVPPNFPSTTENLLAWSLGCLLYNLTFGERWENRSRENSNLSYIFMRAMFEMLKERGRERISLSDCERRLKNLQHFDLVVVYPSCRVVSLLTLKGIYTGQMKYGQLHGKGIFVSNKQFGFGNEVERYTGYYCLDKMHVKGAITYRSGDVFEGEIKNDLPHGQGTLRKQNGNRLTGVWDNSYLSDDLPVEIKYNDGSCYSGYTLKNVPSGRGTMTYTDGSVYTGQFENGHRQGIGKIILENEEGVQYSYEGGWQSDEKKGDNCKEYVEGEFEYEGSYSFDKRHGNGKFTNFKEKYIFEGEFNWGKYHGLGSLEYYELDEAPFSKYKGEFRNGLMEGFGICEYKDGSVYDGQWRSSKKHGEGTFIDSMGNMSDELYDEGVLLNPTEDF